MKNIILISLFSFSVIFCSKKTTLNESNNSEKELVILENFNLKNTKWKLLKLNGREIKIEAKKDVGISFSNDNNFSAYANCNGMGGNIELDTTKNTLKFSKIIATMMVCDDMSLEREFGIMLSKVENYKINKKQLFLMNSSLEKLAEFELLN